MTTHFIKFRNEHTREVLRVVLYTISLLSLAAIFLLFLIQ